MGSPTVNISSASEFSKLLKSSSIVVSDFYADWCGPCKAIAPTYETLSTKFSKPGRITFTKINVDNQQEISQQYGVRAMPTFMIFKSGRAIETIQGADPRRLTSAIESAVQMASTITPPVFSSSGRTLGGGPPRSGQSLQRPVNFQGMIQAIITFVGLYLYSLFSLDPYTSAQNSPFNIHNPVGHGGAKQGQSKQGSQSTAPAAKKLGTISDITGGG